MLENLNRIKGNIMKIVLDKSPNKVAHTYLYLITKKKLINWKKPITYDEKIHWIIVNVIAKETKKYGYYADKYSARKYVKECGLEEILIPLYNVWDSAENKGFDGLPNTFILKTTHSSGLASYSIVKDKI